MAQELMQSPVKGVEYMEITGTQSFEYISKELLSGALSNYYPYKDRNYSLDLNIRGKFTSGAGIEGYFKKSSRIENSDYINLKLFDKHWEAEMGNSQNIGYGSFSSEGKVITVKGKVYNEKASVEGGLGTPEGIYRFDDFQGTNTQGPFQLSNMPVIPMTEKITLLDDGTATQLFNGQDYTIEYRTGRITLSSILRDNQSIQVEYYSENWASFGRLDYYAGAGVNAGMFDFGLNAGGVHFREDSSADTLTDYYVLGADAGFKHSIIYADVQGMTSAEKLTDGGYDFSGSGIDASGGVSHKYAEINGRYYRAFDDFRRVGESGNLESTNAELNAELRPLEWAGLNAGYSKRMNANTDSRSISAGAHAGRDRWGNCTYRYSTNYNILAGNSRTDYNGHFAEYSNRLSIWGFSISGDLGNNTNTNDTLVTKYEKRKVNMNNTFEISKDFGLSVAGNIENRLFADSISNIYGLNGDIRFKRDMFSIGFAGDYLNQNCIGLYSGQGNIMLNIQKYLNLSSKVKAEVNDRYSVSDSIEPEIKYNINNSISSVPFSMLKIRFNNAMIISQGVQSRFMYQRNITNSGNINLAVKYAILNIDGGNGLFLNYRNAETNDLQSNNKRYYINTTLSPKHTGSYNISIFEKYSINQGLTMQYIQEPYSEEIDTVSYMVTQKDLEAGGTLNRSFEGLGNATAGYSYVSNYKTIPDSIPVNAYSHKAYIDVKRQIIKNIDMSLRVTGEKRIGTDPDIEQTDEAMNVMIISPEAGVYYSLPGIGNAGVTYSTSWYSGTSSQQRHKMGGNLGFKKGYFEASGAVNYAISDYYRTLEYSIVIKVVM